MSNENVLALRTGRPQISYSYAQVRALLPEDLRARITPDAASTVDTAMALTAWLAKHGTAFLDRVAHSVLSFIIARTYGEYKHAELIPRSHFLEGVWGADGEIRCRAPVKNAQTLYRSIGVLVGLNFIEKKQITVNNGHVSALFTVNSFVILSYTQTKEEAMTLKLSKKYKALKESEGGVPKQPYPLVPIRTTIVNTNNIVDTKNTNTSRSQAHDHDIEIDCKTKIHQVIAAATSRVIERRQAKAGKAEASGGIPELHGLNALWKEAMVTKYGSCSIVGVTYKDYGIFKRVARVHTVHGSWKEFIDWTVDNWSYINQGSKHVKEQIKSRKGEWSIQDEAGIFLGSDMPSIHHFMRCYLKLLTRYAQEKNKTVQPRDSAEVLRLKRELADRTQEAAVIRQYANKVMSVQTGRVSSAVPQVSNTPKLAINPATDTFFDSDTDFSLPDWR